MAGAPPSRPRPTATDSAGVSITEHVTIESCARACASGGGRPEHPARHHIESVDAPTWDDRLERSLLAKLVNARHKLDGEKVEPACGMLDACSNHLDAKHGQGICSESAADWRARLARMEEQPDWS